ncbi:MAG: AraC family transcriptional regulator [Chloroflexi bacterium]|nr:AraC family transcriptional regulator [Chloroflexota bacterium]
MTINPKIKLYSFKESLPLEIEVVPLSKLYAQHRDKATIPHRTHFYHIIWYQTGAATHLVDFKPVEIKASSLLFVCANRVQAFDPLGACDGKEIVFTESFFSATEADRLFLKSTVLFDPLLDVPALRLEPLSCAPITSMFEAIEAESQNPVDGHQHVILKNLLHNLLLMAEREIHKQGLPEIKKGADFDYTLLFRDALDQQFRELKSVGGYARQIHVSEKRLTQATAQILGRTPKQLIDDRVLLEAKRLLVHSERAIKDIAFELGFNEPTNFIKYFRKHSKITPTEFREKYLV